MYLYSGVNTCIVVNVFLPWSESMRKKPTIPGATLSQNAPVDETVMPAVSQNITAYAVNTEPSQGISG
jgi:hypothetical protein